MEAPRHLMDRARQLRALWDYLPAFRVVAETEHLPTAARALHVSPSALSRAIRLAEEQVGAPLFERAGRRMRLNATGHALLGPVRAAMRLVDEGLGGLAGAGLAGPVVIAATDDVAAWLAAPALAALRAAAPGLVGELVDVPADTPRALRRGDLDVVITPAVPGDGSEDVEALATVSYGLYGAPGRGQRTREVVAIAGAPSPALRGHHVAAVVPSATLAAAACRAGLHAWLPAPLGDLFGLVRVAVTPAQRVTVHAVTRAPVGAHARTEAALAALRAVAARHGTVKRQGKRRR